MDKLGICRKFGGYSRENAAKFLAEFESFARLHELDEEDEARKLAACHLHLQGHALTWYSGLVPGLSWQNVKEVFEFKYVQIGWQHPSIVIENETFQNIQLYPHQEIEDYYCQLIEKGQILGKNDHEIMHKFINGLPEKLTFYVRTSNPKDIAEALSMAKAGEAYKYRIHDTISTAKPNTLPRDTDVTDLKSQVDDLTTLVKQLVTEKLPVTRVTTPNASTMQRNSPHEGPRQPRTCHKCKFPGHMQSECQ